MRVCASYSTLIASRQTADATRLVSLPGGYAAAAAARVTFVFLTVIERERKRAGTGSQ